MAMFQIFLSVAFVAYYVAQAESVVRDRRSILSTALEIKAEAVDRTIAVIQGVVAAAQEKAVITIENLEAKAKSIIGSASEKISVIQTEIEGRISAVRSISDSVDVSSCTAQLATLQKAAEDLKGNANTCVDTYLVHGNDCLRNLNSALKNAESTLTGHKADIAACIANVSNMAEAVEAIDCINVKLVEVTAASIKVPSTLLALVVDFVRELVVLTEDLGACAVGSEVPVLAETVNTVYAQARECVEAIVDAQLHHKLLKLIIHI